VMIAVPELEQPRISSGKPWSSRSAVSFEGQEWEARDS
jgi:hypothetical protein